MSCKQKNIIFITPEELENLPDDQPIYILTSNKKETEKLVSTSDTSDETNSKPNSGTYAVSTSSVEPSFSTASQLPSQQDYSYPNQQFFPNHLFNTCPPPIPPPPTQTFGNDSQPFISNYQFYNEHYNPVSMLPNYTQPVPANSCNVPVTSIVQTDHSQNQVGVSDPSVNISPIHCLSYNKSPMTSNPEASTNNTNNSKSVFSFNIKQTKSMQINDRIVSFKQSLKSQSLNSSKSSKKENRPIRNKENEKTDSTTTKRNTTYNNLKLSGQPHTNKLPSFNTEKESCETVYEYVCITTAAAPMFFERKDDNFKNIVASKEMIALEDRFQKEILDRRPRAMLDKPEWKPLDRSEPIQDDESSSDGDASDSDMDISASDSENAIPPKKRKKQADKNNKTAEQQVNNSSKTKTTVADDNSNKNEEIMPRMVRNLAVRTREHQREIEHKMAHPYKLHTDLWYNEAGEFNDAPSCSCLPKYKVGPLHNMFEGEQSIDKCIPESNNADRLFHYRVSIKPTVNFELQFPTTISYLGNDYVFDGYSLFTHTKITDCPPCEILRFNKIYNLTLIEEDFPENITIRSLDMLSQFIFTDLLELVDLDWYVNESEKETTCPTVHLLPRFIRIIKEVSRMKEQSSITSTETIRIQAEAEMLPVSSLLSYLLDNSGLVIDVMDLPRLHAMDVKEWSSVARNIRGTLVTYPGKKPACIRVDQVDKRSLDFQPRDNVIIFPILVHISHIPIKMSLSRDTKYKKLMKDFLRTQYLLMNKGRITIEDREYLNNLASKLEHMENNNQQRKEVNAEISSDGFFKTGLRTDVSQFALIIPSIVFHLRFHKSLESLEKRMSYTFKDKSLLHQALTHPSFRRNNFGTNRDHVQNSQMTCGFRNIDYGDRADLFREWRRKGLTQMIKIMSYLPRDHETKSNIYGNERLEFLGDAVIEIISSVHLYFLFPQMTEGHMDAYRQALVQNSYLSELAIRLGLHRYLLYAHSIDFCMDSTFTHARSDCFEAVMAAITLDGGLDVADRIFSATLFCDDEKVLKVWMNLPPHVLQAQYPDGDRHLVDQVPILKKLTELEETIGTNFKHIRLLARALTLRQTGFNLLTLGDNQRMEFLGDSLLKYVTTDYLYRHFPGHHEGHLSLLKNSLVNKYTQADICEQLGLHNYIVKRDSKGESTSRNIKYLADLLEAFLGALFVDRDLSWVERFCQVCFWPRLIEFILKQDWNDAKSKLQQCCLTLRALDECPQIAQYRVLDFCGPTNQRSYLVGVYFKSQRLATGKGRSIKEAEMDAAQNALDKHYSSFRQLSFQRKMINKRYNQDFIDNMLNRVAKNDEQLVDRFVSLKNSKRAREKHPGAQSRLDSHSRSSSRTRSSSQVDNSKSSERDHHEGLPSNPASDNDLLSLNQSHLNGSLDKPKFSPHSRYNLKNCNRKSNGGFKSDRFLKQRHNYHSSKIRAPKTSIREGQSPSCADVNTKQSASEFVPTGTLKDLILMKKL